jgi:hypothetical protein
MCQGQPLLCVLRCEPSPELITPNWVARAAAEALGCERAAPWEVNALVPLNHRLPFYIDGAARVDLADENERQRAESAAALAAARAEL